MHRCVVRKRNLGQEQIPVSLVIRHKHRKHRADRLVEAFHETIALWVVARGSRLFDPQMVENVLHQVCLKVAALISVDHTGTTVPGKQLINQNRSDG